MNTQINPALYAKHRAILGTHGALIGKKLFIPRVDVADLKWNDKVRENALRTNRPIMKYYIEDVEIQSVRLVELPNSGKVIIELNDSPKLQFELAPAKFSSVSMNSVKEAIEESRKETPKAIYFEDGIALAEQIKRLNDFQSKDAEDLANELMNMISMFDQLNKKTQDSIDNYYDELSKNANA